MQRYIVKKWQSEKIWQLFYLIFTGIFSTKFHFHFSSKRWNWKKLPFLSVSTPSQCTNKFGFSLPFNTFLHQMLFPFHLAKKLGSILRFCVENTQNTRFDFNKINPMSYFPVQFHRQSAQIYKSCSISLSNGFGLCHYFETLHFVRTSNTSPWNCSRFSWDEVSIRSNFNLEIRFLQFFWLVFRTPDQKVIFLVKKNMALDTVTFILVFFEKYEQAAAVCHKKNTKSMYKNRKK